MIETVILVGQSPNRREPDGNAHALEGRIGQRIARMASLDWDEYLARTQRHNLLDYWPGPSTSGKGDSFPLWAARCEVEHLVTKLDGRVVVLLGLGVARAFSLPKLEFLRWRPCRVKQTQIMFTVAILPHPSSINRWWNDERNEMAAREFLAKIFERQRKLDQP